MTGANGRQPRLFYGWVVAVTSLVCLGLIYGGWHTFSVFLLPISESTGWSRAQTATAFTIHAIVYGVMSPFSGSLVDRWSPRVLIPLGALILAVGMIVSSMAETLWMLYLGFGVFVAVGSSMGGGLPNITVVQRWFVQRRGVAVALAASGTGFGMLFIIPTVQYLVSTFGWRWTYPVLGIATLLLITPVAVIFHRGRPSDMGLRPDGTTASGAAPAKAAVERLVVDPAWTKREWTLRSALGTKRFWLLAFGMTACPVGMTGVLVHGIAYLSDVRFDKMTAAVAVGAIGIISAPSRVAWGYLSDRIGREITVVIAATTSTGAILALLGLQFAGWEGLVWVFSVLFGLGFAAGFPLWSAMAADLFEGRRFGAIYGVLYAGIGLGGGVGPLLAGASYDATGSYTIAFIGAIVVIWLGIASFWLAAPRKVRVVPGKVRRDRPSFGHLH